MEWQARIRVTAPQKAELWKRWQGGQCVADIARALGRRNKSGIYRILTHDGGIGPIPRRRAAGALRLEEREEISRGIAAGRSLREIARDLGRSPSTVSREIGRNGGRQVYRASRADRRAWDLARRSLRWPFSNSNGSPLLAKRTLGWLGTNDRFPVECQVSSNDRLWRKADTGLTRAKWPPLTQSGRSPDCS